MSRKFVVLYKCFSGGEWFEASLNSVCNQADAIVCVFSKTSWTGAEGNDCYKPLASFKKERPDVDIHMIEGEYTRQTVQYQDGLDYIAKNFGDDTMVMIVDTDEVWPEADVYQLKSVMRRDTEHLFFRSGIYTYVKSALYQVYPKEPVFCTVGLASPMIPEVVERFQPRGRCEHSKVRDIPEVSVHHMAYVRDSEDKIRRKFANTSSQEPAASKNCWFDNVWPHLPFGYDLHMSPGLEHVWRQLKGMTKEMLIPELQNAKLTDASIQYADKFWQHWIEHQDPNCTLVPQPHEEDIPMYKDHLRTYTPRVDDWLAAMKTTVLESIRLAELARKYQKLGKLVEIGSGTGGSMIALATGADKSELVCVDPFEPYDEENYNGLATGVTEGDEGEFWRNADIFGYRERVSNIRKYSDLGAAELEDGSCDLVYVDGNHSYDIVKSDLELYWPKVRKGGVLVGHDYTTRFPGVIKATMEWEHYAGITVPHGTSLFFIEKQ